MLEFKYFIFYGSYLVFPFIILLFFHGKKWKVFSVIEKSIFMFFVFLTIVFIDARFIEPNIVTTQTTQIQIGLEKQVKVALISDIHMGIYSKQDLLSKTVEKINTIEDLDYVMIAGDLTYFEGKKTDFGLMKLLQPLEGITVPVYATLGNHDVEFPGPPIRSELREVLDYYKVMLLNNEIVELAGFDLVGLGSLWAGEDDVSLLEKYSESDSVIVLTHNPDTILKYTKPIADITLAGHTHGGQIKIPGVYKRVLPTQGKQDEGLFEEEFGKLFITSGIGVIGLPFRFLNPPVIDILEIK